MVTNVTVSGNIVSELSEKIPSNIIALNELLKNSYDAGANKVKVILDSSQKQLMIIDDGEGMELEDIQLLFHISKSIKKFGHINKYGRYTQGSKGLGFLAVFKFGSKVKWRTKSDKEQGYEFEVDYELLLRESDISKHQIEIKEDETINKGTFITITLNEYSISSLEDYLSFEKNYKKILHAFYDKNFVIELFINGKRYINKSTIMLADISKSSQLYYITYTSEEQKIKFYYNGFNIISEKFTFDDSNYKLNIELLVFHFKSYGKRSISKLFFDPQDDLTPLIYINDNLFNNYDLFNPNIMKNIKTSQVLNQIIGFVRIVSDDPMIVFNSDRTQFAQNELTDSIGSFLSKINKKIQIIGSGNKKYLIDFDILQVNKLGSEYKEVTNDEQFRGFIKNDFSFKEKVAISRQRERVIFSLFGKEKIIKFEPTMKAPISNANKNEPPVPAIINLKKTSELLYVPTNQIDLKDYINSAEDSSGRVVDKKLIIIKVDGDKLDNGILESVTEPTKKVVEYSFLDPETKNIVVELPIIFEYQKADIYGENNKNKRNRQMKPLQLLNIETTSFQC